MAYGKEELRSAVEQILDAEQFEAIGMPRAVEEAAIQLFLNDDAHDYAVRIIKESLSDLRDFGSFRYAPSVKVNHATE
tara:strand:- start:8281 stop:8514 length:234 start_codon:yes stop_codon:yes gene_type:complete